jgi:hypothetical protein
MIAASNVTRCSRSQTVTANIHTNWRKFTWRVVVCSLSNFEGTPAPFKQLWRVTAFLKGFGCRPEHERSIRYKAGVRKPRKKEPAGKR